MRLRQGGSIQLLSGKSWPLLALVVVDSRMPIVIRRLDAVIEKNALHADKPWHTHCGRDKMSRQQASCICRLFRLCLSILAEVVKPLSPDTQGRREQDNAPLPHTRGRGVGGSGRTLQRR